MRAPGGSEEARDLRRWGSAAKSERAWPGHRALSDQRSSGRPRE